MQSRQLIEQSRPSRQVAKQKYRQMLANSKQYQTLCLNQSQLKHMHAIRPYCSKQQQRKSSRREGRHNHSPYQMSTSNSKRLESSERKSEERGKRQDRGRKSSESLSNVGNKQMSEMLNELINLKSQYKMLRGNYTKIVGEKKEEVLRQQALRKNVEEELERKNKELEINQKSYGLLEQEIDRVRKECSRVLEMERFKIRKLQETLQEKELMIAYLRNQLDCLKRGSSQVANPSQPLFFLQNSTPMLNFSYYPRPNPNTNPNISALSSIPGRQSYPQEDSLCLSRDKSKEADSIIHSFLSNNDHNIQHPLPYHARKEVPTIPSLQESPIEVQIEPIEERSEPSEKESMDFKKGKDQKDFVDIAMQGRAKGKNNMKKLQILIADQNSDTQNIPSKNLRDELSLQTKKKMSNNNNSLVMCKQKKKLTAKKIKPF